MCPRRIGPAGLTWMLCLNRPARGKTGCLFSQRPETSLPWNYRVKSTGQRKLAIDQVVFLFNSPRLLPERHYRPLFRNNRIAGGNGGHRMSADAVGHRNWPGGQRIVTHWVFRGIRCTQKHRIACRHSQQTRRVVMPGRSFAKLQIGRYPASGIRAPGCARILPAVPEGS